MVETGLLNAIVTGLVTGSVITLGAIGLSLVYSIAEVPNFAHGELLMLGAYVGLFVNRPDTVPVFELLAPSPGTLSAAGVAVLFLLTVVSVLLVVYQLDGREGLAGSYWPVEVTPAVGYAGHAGIGGLVGGVVVLTAPSIWGGLLLAIVLMAAFSPAQERFLFRKFRDKGTDLATMLIVALGLSFILRFTTQAIYGGQVRGYEVPNIASIGGAVIPLSDAQLFDFWVAGSGLVVRTINTGVPGGGRETLFVAAYGPLAVAALVALPIAAAVGAYRWRSVGASTAGQTVGPRLTGALAGTGVLIVLGVLLPGTGTPPESWIAATRIRLSPVRGLTILLALTLMGALHVVLKETRLGTAMRAASDNMDLAQVTGINTRRVMTATWIIAGVYAGVAGVMLGILFASMTPNMGFFWLLPIFAGVILGGIGSVYGAMLGSFVVGLSMEVGINLLGISSTLRVPLAFAVLFVVLLVKPEGIVGGS